MSRWQPLISEFEILSGILRLLENHNVIQGMTRISPCIIVILRFFSDSEEIELSWVAQLSGLPVQSWQRLAFHHDIIDLLLSYRRKCSWVNSAYMVRMIPYLLISLGVFSVFLTFNHLSVFLRWPRWTRCHPSLFRFVCWPVCVFYPCNVYH